MHRTGIMILAGQLICVMAINYDNGPVNGSLVPQISKAIELKL